MKEIHHEYTDETTCPYCGHEESDSWEIAGDDDCGETECGSCDKKYLFSRSVSVSYSTTKSPCLNGEAPHDFKEIRIYPTTWKLFRCRECSTEERRENKPSEDGE